MKIYPWPDPEFYLCFRADQSLVFLSVFFKMLFWWKMRGINFLKILFITPILILSLYSTIKALTLEETIFLAQKAYPPLKEKRHLYEQNRFLYKASFAPYYPTLSSDVSYQRTFESSLNSIGRLWDNQYTLGLNINYRLFDGGYRYSIKEQSFHAFGQTKTDIKTIENDLSFMVKEAFYTVLAKKKSWKCKKKRRKSPRKIMTWPWPGGELV
jgi:hypothetical protein